MVITNEDNMELMARYEDNHFDLAIVDPPYGILSKAGDRLDKYGKKHKSWDEEIPNEKYFKELFRVSQNQIVWGGNYFPILWGTSCKGFIFWHKHQPIKNWAAGEMAWSSFDRPAMCFDYMCYGGVNQDPHRFHPTQKPVALYEWLLKNYAKEGDKILDTHLGSGSIAIAVDRMNKIEGMNLTLTACELDEDYYKAAMKRINEQTSQTAIVL